MIASVMFVLRTAASLRASLPTSGSRKLLPAASGRGDTTGSANDVVGLDAGKLFEDGPRRVPEARALLPHFETFPEHEGEEANEDVSLDAVLALMPDRTQVQLILLNAKRGFGLGELDVSLPELLVAPIADVRAQEIGALRERGPIIERGVVIDAEAKARRAAVRLQDDREAGGSALVLLELDRSRPGR